MKHEVILTNYVHPYTMATYIAHHPHLSWGGTFWRLTPVKDKYYTLESTRVGLSSFGSEEST